MTTDDLFEHLEKYYGRKEREPYYSDQVRVNDASSS